ncbi:MAG: response regulator [Deltaproteobacteria bacterium]|nr:response regulator [Deltaproteobacteria bacterium]MBW2139164.1 response regulator [Deltaproteobacteria bacterium]
MAKIMVVDDDNNIRELLRKFLSRKGYEVITASDGEEALEKIAECPEIILLDIMMPKIHGLKVLNRIKKQSPKTEIIMMTGLALNVIGLESLKRGAFEFVTKPLDLEHVDFLISYRLAQMGAL